MEITEVYRKNNEVVMKANGLCLALSADNATRVLLMLGDALKEDTVNITTMNYATMNRRKLTLNRQAACAMCGTITRTQKLTKGLCPHCAKRLEVKSCH